MFMHFVILICAAADLILKQKIEDQDPSRFPRLMKGSKGTIMLYRNHNAGFPFGFMEKYHALIVGFPLTITAGLAAAFVRLEKAKERPYTRLALAVVIGGSISNLYDRIFRKYVIDYFSFQFGRLKKVVFNLGDLCVFAGSARLIYEYLKSDSTRG